MESRRVISVLVDRHEAMYSNIIISFFAILIMLLTTVFDSQLGQEKNIVCFL